MQNEMPVTAYYTRASAGFNTDNVVSELGDIKNQRQIQWLRQTQGLQNQQQYQEERTDMATRRIIQVIIADVNENVPLESCVLYKGEEKLSDSTDQELFFESNIADKLVAHNTKRVKWLDKEATKRSGRDVYLEPAKIRELKMVVVTIAQF